jgi:hypothetical protein
MGWPRPTATTLQWHGPAASQAERPGSLDPSWAPGSTACVAWHAQESTPRWLPAGGGVSHGGPKQAVTRRSATLGFGRRRLGQKERRCAPLLGRRHGGGSCWRFTTAAVALPAPARVQVWRGRTCWRRSGAHEKCGGRSEEAWSMTRRKPATRIGAARQLLGLGRARLHGRAKTGRLRTRAGSDRGSAAALVQWRLHDSGGGGLNSHGRLWPKGCPKQREAGCLEDLSEVLMSIWLRQLPRSFLQMSCSASLGSTANDIGGPHDVFYFSTIFKVYKKNSPLQKYQT